MPPEAERVPSTFGDPSRRTYLAAERTLLAWWRTGFGALGVALAVGKLLPDTGNLPRVPFLGLGCGWAVLAAALIVYGARRQRLGRAAIDDGGFLHLDDGIARIFAGYVLALIVATAVMLCAVS